MKTLENVLISNLTTMRLGGLAKYVIEVEKVEDIEPAFLFAEEKGLKTFILGAGANSIGKDEGFDGVILLNKIHGIEILAETEKEVFIRAMGGEKWDDLVQFSTKKKLSGIELLSKIPGTVGAAPVQNIGAYGQDVASVLENVEVFDAREKKVLTIPKEDLGFSYRKSIFNSEEKGRYFIFAITLKLEKNKKLNPPFYMSLQNYVDENNVKDFSPENLRKIVAEIRDEKLPDPEKEASSGSFFKNVYVDDAEAEKLVEKGIKVWRNGKENKINSGWLIEEAGLKNKTFHGMRVNGKAALVLINDSAKSYNDLSLAREEIREIVKEKFGFFLEQEPVEIE